MNNENLDTIMTTHKNIGANIRYFRKKSNLTIEQLLEIVKIASGFLGLIEINKERKSLADIIVDYANENVGAKIYTDTPTYMLFRISKILHLITINYFYNQD